MQDINIPDFITLVSSQIREAVQRFKNTGGPAILYLNGLQLNIAFTAEESTEAEGGIQLKPWVFSLKAGAKSNQKTQFVHSVSLALSAVVPDELPPPFKGADLKEEDFFLLLEVARELRTSHQGSVFVGPDTELIPPFMITWRGKSIQIQTMRRFGKRLLQDIERINKIEDVGQMYDGALQDIYFIPTRQPSGFAPPPQLPAVGFR